MAERNKNPYQRTDVKLTFCHESENYSLNYGRDPAKISTGRLCFREVSLIWCG